MVGVVGAARVPGIRKMWSQADTPDFKLEVQDYMTVPYSVRSGTSVIVPVAITGGSLPLLGTLTCAAV